MSISYLIPAPSAETRLAPANNRFELLHMIQIMPAHRLHQRLERYFAALRMRHALRKRFRRSCMNERQIPSPQRGKYGQRRWHVIRRIRHGPLILIERLYHVMILRKRLPQPVRKNHFAIRQMANNLPRTPFPRRNALFDTFRPKRSHKCRQLPGSRRNHFQRILPCQVFRIRILFHRSKTISRSPSRLKQRFCRWRAGLNFPDRYTHSQTSH